MLHLLLGQTGTGKTEQVLREVRNAATAGEVLLMVPEHASFEMERRASDALSGTDAMRVKVLSFPRLAENIFRNCGGLAHRPMDDTARIVIMRMAVNAVKDSLCVYRKQSGYSGFLSSLLDEIAELKRAGLSPEGLGLLLDDREADTLSGKLRDIQLIYAAYQAMLERSFHDPLDDVEMAAELAAREKWFSGSRIWLDGFDYFSVNERKMLEIMLNDAAEITFSVTADSLEGDQDVFVYQKKFLRRLIRFAAEHEIPVQAPIVLEGAARYRSPGLQALRNAMADPSGIESMTDDSVRVISTENPYDELRAAAAEICRLVRAEGCRYQDCAVLCRDLDRYAGARFLFEQYGIPYFCSEKDNLLSHALPTFLCAALRAVSGGDTTSNILSIARSEASGISPEDAGRLENYCYIWSIGGSGWNSVFTSNPEGMSDEPPERYADAVGRIEETRRNLMGPLNELQNAVRQCSGGQFAAAIYRYVVSSGAIKNLAAGMSEQQKEELDREWNHIVDILDLFSDFFAQSRLEARELAELFSLALSQVDMGNVPNTIDHVIFAEADRVRLQSPKVVFVLGVNEGLFPANSGDTGLFSTKEREELNARGIEVPVSGADSALREQFILYMAVSSASERMYISYPRRTLQGDGDLQPSVLLSRVMRRLSLSEASAGEISEETLTVNTRTAKMQLARRLAEGKDAAAGVLERLLDGEDESACGAALRRVAENAPAPDVRADLSRSLLGGKILLSPTAIDRFYQCPYLYFCDKMLRLRPLQKVEYSPFESGSAIHYVFEQILNRHGSKRLAELSPQETDREIGEYLEEYLRKMVPDSDKVSARFNYQFARLRLMLRIILRHMAQELAQSEFVTAATEVKVGTEGEILPPSLLTSSGTEVEVRGSIDRVDLFHSQEGTYLRVIDYKSGEKDFDLREVEYGLNMQMLIYLYAACDDRNGRFGAPLPAGILYVPSKISAAETAADVSEETLQKEIDASLRMKGLLLEDENVLRAMEKELMGKYIPVACTSKGAFSKSSKLGSAEQFRQLRGLVRDNIVNMGERLENGAVSPDPIRIGSRTPCDYCPYGALCNNNTPEGRCRTMKKDGEEGEE